MGRNFSIASKKHQNDFDVLVIVRKRLKKGIAISFLELSTVAPKPRAEGSSQLISHKEHTSYKNTEQVVLGVICSVFCREFL